MINTTLALFTHPQIKLDFLHESGYVCQGSSEFLERGNGWSDSIGYRDVNELENRSAPQTSYVATGQGASVNYC